MLALVLAALPALAQAASGIDWLATQQNADGSFGSNPASLATPLQGTAEVLYTYQALEETAQAAYAPALEYVNTNNEINTEYLARTIMVNAGAGTDVTSLLQTLLDHQNADGGFGDHPGYDSSVYDTAWALEAMAVIGYPLGDTIGRTVGFLINHQLSSGGWVDGENDSSPYVSALVLQALGHYREAYVGVAATVSRAQDFLFAQRSGDGTWGTPFVTASAMVALLSTISDRALLDASVVALSGAQSADGSWVQDAYTTALALRAIHAHDTHPSGAPAPGGPTPPPPAPDKGSFTGSVKIAGSNAPLAGVTLTISELPSVSTATGSDGTFSITQLAPGPYTLIARKDGYLSATVVSGITAGQVTQIGNLVLQQVSQTGIVRGVVLEAGFDLGLANAVVTLKGASETFGASDDGGRFDLGAVVPGDYTLTVTKTNFNTVTTTLSVLAGKIYETKFSLTREGVYDDRPGNVFGRVVNGENGNPIVGALIDLGNGQTAAADTEGNFLITDVPRATYTGSVSNGGFQTVPFTLVLSPVCSGNLGTITLYPEVPEAVPPSTLTLVGTLVDAQTQDPIAGATVSTGSTSATTDTNGAFTLADLTTTSNLVTASATGYQTGQYQINASGFGSAKVTLALNEDTGVPPPDPNAIYGATGIVLDAGTNQPLAGVTVGGLFGGQQHTTITGADGRFTLTGLVSNEGDIQFLLDGYLSKAIRVNLAPLTITRIGQVLLREDSAPLPDIVVSSINTQEAPTDPHTLQISGSVAVTITNQGTASTSANVSLLAFYDVDRNERYDDGIDLLLGKGTSANALDAGAAEEVLVQIEGTVPYRDVVIRLWADSTEVIEESDEANNMSSSVSACEVIPPTPTFDTVVKWHSSLRLTVSHTPVVGPLRDTNGDGAVDKNDAPVIVYHQGGWFSGSYGLIAVDGRSGAMLWNYTGAGFSLAIAPAIGDVDGDGKPEVLAIVQSGGIIVVAINGNGTEKWRSAVAMDISSLAVTIADLEGDGQAEILAGNIVLNSDGSLKWRASTSDIDRNLIIPIAVDLDLDGTKEVIIGPRAYRADGSVYWDISAQYPRAQFRPAVANLDDDPYPEVVSVLLPPGSPTRLIAFNHDGTLAWERVGAGGRGAPTIVDLDGDGSVEILLGGWTAFRVFSDTGAIKWSVTPGDPSSGSTGATAFDFDRDGILEIVYANEENLRIFSWKTKQLLASFPRFSATWYEYPVVADIDNDGRAEILVTTAGDGLYALEEVNDLWPATRGIWNQEAYYIDNVNDDGSIPTQERNSWQTHNTYRVNAPLPEAFQSADVTVSLLRALDNGPGQPLSLSVRIGNGGAAASPEGVSVSFYEGDPAASGVLLGTVSAPSLAPDSFQDVVLNNVTALTGNADIYGVADPDDRVPECNETNNSVHIPAPNVLPDLIVSAIDAGAASTDPATLQLTGSVTATIKNQGTKEATGSIDILVFYDVNRNGLYDIGGDLVLGRATFDQAVAVGSSQTAEINVQGNMLFRDAPLKVFVDSAMRVEESDEGNNINTSAVSCKVVPDIGTFEPVLKWEWSGSPVLSQFDQVMSIPIVATIEDTNGDNVINLQDTPSVIFHSYAGGNYRSNGVLRALSGKDGRELWTVTDVAYRTNPEGSIAVADIDGDGIIEIIAPKNGGGIIVFEHTGAYKWQSAVPRAVFWGGASISDLDGDGTPEIVVGNTALNADGSLRWQGVGFAGNNGLGPLSVVADINLDGIPEVVAGAAAYSSDGQRLWQNSSVGDGFTAVGNFNEDPYPEIALVS
ncbi:MAG TPA: hypothetical protein DCO71_05170, partial [Gammaproteobacteria bacterium]|nr:hypothetical protein [Gammaproteobacteria bacterium]